MLILLFFILSISFIIYIFSENDVRGINKEIAHIEKKIKNENIETAHIIEENHSLNHEIENYKNRYFQSQLNLNKDLVKINEVSLEARQSNVLIELGGEFNFLWGLFHIPYTESQGSGFVYKKDATHYYVLTNYHVAFSEVLNKPAYQLTLHDGTEVKGTLVAMGSNELDLAVLKFLINNRTIPLIEIDTQLKLSVGDPVITIGNPKGVHNVVNVTKITSLNALVSVENNNGTVTNIPFPVINLIYLIEGNGNSGGAVLTLEGKLAGVLFAGSTEMKACSAVPLEKVILFLKVNHLY
jgi:S1-C subfamily serine protease